MFADNCILYKYYPQQLQSDLDSLYLWAETWLMKFNTSKCYINSCISSRLNNYVNNKYLGIMYIQSSLTLFLNGSLMF